MTLKDISIINYKNISDASLSLSPKINCFIGNNGEGKTNLLDAVYYLSFCRSTGTNVDSSLIRHDGEFFMIKGRYSHDTTERPDEEIYAAVKRGQRKQFRRGGKAYKHLSEHIGLIPLIIASPDDPTLISGGSEGRRKLLDLVIAQYDATYIDSLNRYGKALQQRNVLLKADGEPDETLLALWEVEMAKHGEYIYNRRADFLKEFVPTFNNMYSRISKDKETVSLKYISHCQRGPLLEVIRRDRHKDMAVGYSLHGVHRDDLEMLIGGYPMRNEGSQGQAKTYVLALKLAQFDFLRRTVSATTPLLLLDDIFDKLDADRVENIINLVAQDAFGQIFITDTNRSHLDLILAHTQSPYKIFNVSGGNFQELQETQEI